MGNEEIRLPLFIDDMIAYVECPKSSVKKNLLDLINGNSKDAQYKVNMQKSIVFLFTSNVQLKFKLRIQYHLY